MNGNPTSRLLRLAKLTNSSTWLKFNIRETFQIISFWLSFSFFNLKAFTVWKLWPETKKMLESTVHEESLQSQEKIVLAESSSCDLQGCLGGRGRGLKEIRGQGGRLIWNFTIYLICDEQQPRIEVTGTIKTAPKALLVTTEEKD